MIQNDNSGNFSLTVREALSEDSGQYWVEAENVDGKDHTVAWVQVLSKPGTPHSLDYKIIEENTIQLDWSESRKGNSNCIWYRVEYKLEGNILCFSSIF